jgi:hypothetical protein
MIPCIDTYKPAIRRSMIRTKQVLGILKTSFAVEILAQSRQYDALSIPVIDRMSDVIGGRESCNFWLSNERKLPAGYSRTVFP